MYLEEELAGELRHARLPKAQRHGDERIVAAAGCDGVELVFPALKALLKVVDDVLHRLLLGALRGQAHAQISVHEHRKAGLGVLVEQLIDAGDGEAAILLAGCGEHDVANDVEGDVERLGLVVPQVAHLKAAAEYGAHVEQAAVHGVAARGHVVDVDVAVVLRLKLLDGEEELLIELLVELVEDEAAAGGDERAVRVGILLVADVHDRLGLLVDLVEHLHEVGLVVAVIAVGLGDGRIDLIERALHEVVHLLNLDALGAQCLALFGDKPADEVDLLG